VPRLLEVFDQKIQMTIDNKGIIAKALFKTLINLSYFSQRYLHLSFHLLFFKTISKKFGGQLKTILCGSAQLTEPLQKHFLSYGFLLRCSYGLTETTGGITLTKPRYRFKKNTVGQCVDQNDLSISADGEIIYDGPALMQGYFRDDATNSVIKNGFLYTGDLGKLDRNKNLFVTGRIKELIVFQDGKKAMPEQIENQYQSIVGVDTCAVFGFENQAILAYQLTENVDAQLTMQKIFHKSTQLKSPYKIADVMLVDELPRSNTLKIKRHELLRQYQLIRKKKNIAVINQQPIQKLMQCFQEVLPKKIITETVTFAELGIDSLTAIQLCEIINTTLGLHVQPTTFWSTHTIRELNDMLQQHKSTPPKPIKKSPIDERIAIVAVDGIFPMGKTIDHFWENLLNGKDVITEVPLSRWNYHEYYDPYLLAPGKTNSKWGGFIDLPDDFNYQYFGIKKYIADEMDPQQKILLMLTQRLLENYSGKNEIKKWQGTNTGYFIGDGFSDFMLSQMQHLPIDRINPYSGIGMADVMLCTRPAFHFGFEGPAIVLKTACSSSLVAVHQAMRALQMGDCDYAIAGGINLTQIPEINICLTKGGFLSPDGRCKTFDASANGYVRSEGCGLVLLKRYSDAIKDNDKILSVIVGSAINQDGASNGITAPNGKSQIACYQKALQNAGISAEKVGYIEAHGTGTQLGDAIEMQSIQAVYDQSRSEKLYVGAVKSSIGHCESAAGIAGLIKTMMVLNHQITPPNLHYHQQNPNIHFENSAIVLPKNITRFEKPCEYAAVSSFGIAGTNVHMIISAAG
jgi:3-oxoacyl-(acyl-carrier-protein) synthase/acyl carrier protein